MGIQIIFGLEIFWVQTIFMKKNWGNTNFGFKKKLCPKIFCVQKDCIKKNCPKYRVSKNCLHPKYDFVYKNSFVSTNNVLSKNNFCPKLVVCPTNNFVLKKIG